MNRPHFQDSDWPPPEAVSAKFEQCVRENPGLSVGVCVAAGVCIGVAISTLIDSPTSSRSGFVSDSPNLGSRLLKSFEETATEAIRSARNSVMPT